MTRRAILLKWILYCLCALALALLQGLVLVYVRVWGVHPFLLPAIAVIPATLERNEQAGVVYHRTGVVGDYDGFDSEEALIAFLLAQEREPGCSSP